MARVNCVFLSIPMDYSHNLQNCKSNYKMRCCIYVQFWVFKCEESLEWHTDKKMEWWYFHNSCLFITCDTSISYSWTRSYWLLYHLAYGHNSAVSNYTYLRTDFHLFLFTTFIELNDNGRLSHLWHRFLNLYILHHLFNCCFYFSPGLYHD